MNHQPNLRNPELASSNEVREFNIIAKYLVDAYGREVRNIFSDTKQAFFTLIDAEGGLVIRETPPISEEGERNPILRAIFARIVEQYSNHRIWHVVSVETEGDNPSAVIADDTYLELSNASAAETAIKAYGHQQKVEPTGHEARVHTSLSEQIETNPLQYSSDFHGLTMKVLRNIKAASLAPNRPIER